VSAPLLSIEAVGKTFDVAGRHARALDSVTLEIVAGECHAIVGESGSGKTTLANLIIGLHAPTEGVLKWKGEALPAQRPLALKRAIQIVQQNPRSALNPRRQIAASIRLPLDVHTLYARRAREGRVILLLEEVGLDASFLSRSPRDLSGGQLQRVAIARALACEPELILLDEPTSSLDVLVQARVLKLLDKLRREHGLTYLFISHDLAVVRAVADRVSVFDRGRLVETAGVEALFAAPRHEATRRLIEAIPVVTEAEAELRDRFRAETLSKEGQSP
jgi:peptide/nickel transport system ATP-binding protein